MTQTREHPPRRRIAFRPWMVPFGLAIGVATFTIVFLARQDDPVPNDLECQAALTATSLGITNDVWVAHGGQLADDVC